MLHSRKLLLVVGALTCLMTSAFAQVQAGWLPGVASPGPAGVVATSTRWDPDGTGPIPERIVVGGTIDMPCRGGRNLLAYEPISRLWTAFAEQPNGRVTALTMLADGRLAVAGAFTAIGNQPSTGLALFDGATWTHVPCGNYGSVTCMIGMPDGSLVIGGTFSTLADLPIVGLGRWDGSQWNGFPFIGALVTTLALRANGRLLVGGEFPTNVAEWTGLGWISFPPGFAAAPYSLIELPNGNIVIGGVPGGIAMWNGSSWTGIAGAAGYQFYEPSSLLVLPNGDLLAASIYTIGSTPVVGVARWDGSQWTPYAPGNRHIEAMYLLPNGDLLATGGVNQGIAPHGVALWNGSEWSDATSGFDGAINGVFTGQDAELFAYGEFEADDLTYGVRSARFDGQDWTPLPPTGVPLSGRDLVCGARDPDTGELWFGEKSGNVLRGDGTTWSVLGNHRPRTMLFADGRLVIGGELYGATQIRCGEVIGNQLQAIGGDVDGPVFALLRHSSGDLIVGGDFLVAGGVYAPRIARWDGVAWHAFHFGLDGPVHALAELPNGDIVAGGTFQNDAAWQQVLPLIARWNGSAWQPMGGGFGGTTNASVNALQVLPGGDLVAAGWFSLGNIARWNGATWSVVDGGLDGEVRGLTLGEDLLAVGLFGRAGSQESAHLARLRSASPATVERYGAGCSSSLGLLELSAEAMPWLGATYRASGRIVQQGSLGIDVYGLTSTSLSLASLLPISGPACQLLAAPDFVVPQVVLGTRVESQLSLPSAMSLLGLELFHQVAVLEFTGATPSLLSSSNGLKLTLGSF